MLLRFVAACSFVLLMLLIAELLADNFRAFTGIGSVVFLIGFVSGIVSERMHENFTRN